MLLAVHNRGCNIRRGWLVAYLPDDQRHSMPLGTLRPATGRSWKLGFAGEVRDAGVQLRAETGRGPDAVAGAVPLPAPARKAAPGLTTAAVAALGLIGTLAGVWLTAGFASRRERRGQAFTWNEQVFEKYEPAYRSFLSTWAGSSNPAMLKQAFDRLSREAIVPVSLVAEVDRVHGLLVAQEASNAAQSEARKLYERFRKVLTDPLGFAEA
jgi:hypothetical protein